MELSEAVNARFAPPQAEVVDVAPGEAVLAGRGMRLLAFVIDVIFLVVAWWAALKIPVLGPMVDAESAGQGAITPWSFGLELALFLPVQGWLLVTRSQTLGKMLFRLRIVRSDGSRPDAWRLLGLRYGIGLVTNLNFFLSAGYALIDSLLIFRKSRRCLHDSIADTKVIKL